MLPGTATGDIGPAPLPLSWSEVAPEAGKGRLSYAETSFPGAACGGSSVFGVVDTVVRDAVPEVDVYKSTKVQTSRFQKEGQKKLKELPNRRDAFVEE
ncbi:hypothetical protein UY3_01785 [Chelonia mydas]|uniref:Uncharacterized protein n=1 Tax=Chelonia mydas TaxID=8469 RepID=M7C8N6_CHEMY|nr:hypothetical protein UY3_01785 [Chelonia mydas]